MNKERKRYKEAMGDLNFEWIYKYDRDMNYSALFVLIISFGLLYFFGGEQALVLLLIFWNIDLFFLLHRITK